MSSWNIAHIPKTAGTSLVADLQKAGVKLTTQEMPSSDPSHAATMLRYPENHLTSMYEHCRAVQVLQYAYYHNGDDLSGFEKWVDDALANPPSKTDSLSSTKLHIGFHGCFSPWNLQTRFFADGKDDPWLAMRRLDAYAHIGTTERYAETLHHFNAKEEHHITHMHENKLRVELLPERVRVKMYKLIQSDMIVYAYAVSRAKSIHNSKEKEKPGPGM